MKEEMKRPHYKSNEYNKCYDPPNLAFYPEKYVDDLNKYIDQLEQQNKKLKETILKKLNTAIEYYENDKTDFPLYYIFSTRAKSMKNYIDEAIEILNDEND